MRPDVQANLSKSPSGNWQGRGGSRGRGVERLSTRRTHWARRKSNFAFRISHFASRVSDVASRVSNVESRVSNVESRLSNLASRIAHGVWWSCWCAASTATCCTDLLTVLSVSTVLTYSTVLCFPYVQHRTVLSVLAPPFSSTRPRESSEQLRDGIQRRERRVSGWSGLRCASTRPTRTPMPRSNPMMAIASAARHATRAAARTKEGRTEGVGRGGS